MYSTSTQLLKNAADDGACFAPEQLQVQCPNLCTIQIVSYKLYIIKFWLQFVKVWMPVTKREIVALAKPCCELLHGRYPPCSSQPASRLPPPAQIHLKQEQSERPSRCTCSTCQNFWSCSDDGTRMPATYHIITVRWVNLDGMSCEELLQRFTDKQRRRIFSRRVLGLDACGNPLESLEGLQAYSQLTCLSLARCRLTAIENTVCDTLGHLTLQ